MLFDLVCCPVPAFAEQIKTQFVTATDVPPPITRSAPATVVVEMETKEYVGTRAEGIQYKFRSVNGPVPGPMIRGMTGSLVKNPLLSRGRVTRLLPLMNQRHAALH